MADESVLWLAVGQRYIDETEPKKLPKRVNHATVYDSATGKAYILGGYNYTYKKLLSQPKSVIKLALRKLDCFEFDCSTTDVCEIVSQTDVEIDKLFKT